MKIMSRVPLQCRLVFIIAFSCTIGCGPGGDTTQDSEAVVEVGSITATENANIEDDEDGFWDVIPPEFNPDTPAPKMLSEYNLFADIPKQIPNADVLPYDLNTSHFADYAVVKRFIRLPEGAQVEYDASAAFAFPPGALLIQTLGYPKDLRRPDENVRLVETRVMRRLTEGWDGVAYKWNAEQTDARRSVAGGLIDVAWTHYDGEDRALKYIVPNKNDCKRCHDSDGKMIPIGPTAANLNREVGDGEPGVHQLKRWSDTGHLNGLPDLTVIPRFAQSNVEASGTIEERARAWLAVNCAHCHNPHGQGAVSGLDLSAGQNSPVRLGIFKPPVAAGRGSEGHRFSIDPGSPETSFLMNRLRSTDPSVMMPPTGRRLADEEALTLVGEWIAQMEFDEDETDRLKEEQQALFEKLQAEGAALEN
jgi:uncharacterized repeat protein (TIGR03806 family)